MPVTKHAKKKLRKDIRREKKNKQLKSNLRKTLKDTRKTTTLKKLSSAARIIDKAAKKNVIHKNKAARLKSRLYRMSKTSGTSKASSSKKKK